MQLTPTITLRGIERTAALETDILTRPRKLETYYPGIMGCHVIVEMVQRHHEAGNRYARRQRGAVKTTAKPARGRVSQLLPIDEYGYIEADDGHEVYFPKSSVLKDAFERLAVGSAVSFVEEAGEKGPQASTVKLLHPRRVHRSSQTAPGARVER